MDEEIGDDLYLYPNFSYNPIIYNGDLTIEIFDWDGKSTTLKNPTRNDVLRFFANNHDGHHGYLEGIEFKDNKLILYSGS